MAPNPTLTSSWRYILKKIKNFKDYNVEREIPSHHGTTRLSAYLKFNVVSIREVYETFKENLSKSKFIILRELNFNKLIVFLEDSNF